MRIFTWKHLCWSLFLIKLEASGLQIYQTETPTQVFPCDYCKVFKKTYFEEHLRTAASVCSKDLLKHYNYLKNMLPDRF